MVYVGTKTDLLQTVLLLLSLLTSLSILLDFMNKYRVFVVIIHYSIQNWSPYKEKTLLLQRRWMSWNNDSLKWVSIRMNKWNEWLSSSSCIPETYQQRRSRYIKKTLQISSYIALIGGSRSGCMEWWIVAAGCIYLGKNGIRK